MVNRILPLGLLMVMLSSPMLQLLPTASAATISIKEYDQIMTTVTSGAGCFYSTYPVEQWVETPCATNIPQAPETVGNGVDYIAHVSGTTKVSYVTAAFSSVSGITGESDSTKGTDYYSLQINSNNGFSCTVPTVGGTWTDCWEQFVFQSDAVSAGAIFIQDWLIGYLNSNTACPTTSWAKDSPSNSCYIDGTILNTGYITPTNTNLFDLSFTGEANYASSGNDYVDLCNGLGTCWHTTQADSYLQLYQNWTDSEFNIFGLQNRTQANFTPSTGVTIKPEQGLESSGGGTLTPTCTGTSAGTTGETNNLSIVSNSCSVNGAGVLGFTEDN